MKINNYFTLFLLLFALRAEASEIDRFINNLSGNVATDGKNLIKNQPADRFVDYAKLQILNKSSGEATVIDVKIGDKVRFEDLEIEALKCWKSYPEEKIENKLLLKISEKSGLIKKDLFYGWFFSSTPSLSDLEHPLYDVKLLNCYNLETEEKDANN